MDTTRSRFVSCGAAFSSFTRITRARTGTILKKAGRSRPIQKRILAGFGIFYCIVTAVPFQVLLIIFVSVMLAFIICLKEFWEHFDNTPMLYYKDSTFVRFIIRKCPKIKTPFCPPFWASSAYPQMLLSWVLPQPDMNFRRQFLLMKDQGVVALDWANSTTVKSLRKSTPVLLIIPNMLSTSKCFSRLCKDSLQKGFRPLVFIRRGHCGCPLTTPRLQSFGDPQDLRQVVKYIRCKYPTAKLIAVGYGLGSGLLISYLGEYGSSSHLHAASCISACLDSEPIYRSNITNLCKWYMLMGMKLLVFRNATGLSHFISIPGALQSKSLGRFEQNVYCQLYGFDSIEQYWEKNNPNRDLDEISTPLLCINSCDDPICLRKDIPMDLFELYPNFLLVLTKKGGHAGFVDGIHLNNWAERLSLDYLQSVLQFHEQFV